MTIELTMMHRLALFLGNPTYSLTVVLVIILLSSAAGSLWAGRKVHKLGNRLPMLSLASILLSIITWSVCGTLSPSLDLGTGWRVLVTALLLTPQGFVMGIFLPTGLAWVSERAENLVPWAWAVNGATSVAGSLGTVILAMNFGYSRVLIAGTLCYALTFPLLRTMAGKGKAARKEVDL
jgi:MFS family permease